MKTSDIPFMKERDVAEAKSDAKTAKPASSGSLGRAAESSDPAVHKLLAEIQTAVMNDDKDAQEAAYAELKELGFE